MQLVTPWNHPKFHDQPTEKINVFNRPQLVYSLFWWVMYPSPYFAGFNMIIMIKATRFMV